MPQVVLTHDDRVGDFVTAGAGVRLAGTVRVDEGPISARAAWSARGAGWGGTRSWGWAP